MLKLVSRPTPLGRWNSRQWTMHGTAIGNEIRDLANAVDEYERTSERLNVGAWVKGHGNTTTDDIWFEIQGEIETARSALQTLIVRKRGALEQGKKMLKKTGK